MKIILCNVSILCFLGACSNSRIDNTTADTENTYAKKQLQGIWIDEFEEDVCFRIKGDTVFFPDETNAPLYFKLLKDTMIMYGANTTKYPIIKQTSNSFVFEIPNGEHVRLVKSNDSTYLNFFNNRRIIPLNQKKLIKNDTIIYFNEEKFHCYVQINPTTFKVFRASYNEDGVEVDNIYYDNIIHLSIFKGSRKLYSSNVKKADFEKIVSKHFLNQSVLSDISFYKVDDGGIHFFAILGIPNSPSNFMIEYIVNFKGQVIKRIKK